jgi:diguanylate cyclase (GGDEF)-like protein
MASLVLAAGIAVWTLRQAAIADAEDDNHRLGVVLAEQTTRTLQAVDLVLQEVCDKILSAGVYDRDSLYDTFGTRDVHDALVRRMVNLPQTEAFTILDATGHIVNGSRQWPPPVYSLSDQDYFRDLAATPDPNPYVSAPGKSRSSGEPTVFLARRLTALDGSFLGVIVAPILLNYFESFLSHTGFSDGSGVTILRRDGILLMRFPGEGIQPGRPILSTVGWHQVVAQGGGHYHSTGGFIDGRPLFVSVHPLTLYPLVVDVTRTETATLARWWRQAIAIGLATLLSSVTLTLLLWALGRQINVIAKSRQQIVDYVATIKASETRLATQSALLETTLEHMNQGLIMVDANGFVAIYNRRALEILDLPMSLMEGHPSMADLFEYQRERGEFAENPDGPFDAALMLNNRAAYERRRPNGMMVEIRSAPLAGGGMVRTYTDITARVAAEEMLGLAASQDQLTGLANRNGFNTSLDLALAAAKRGNTEMSVLCIDLDRFKAVNDTFGHSGGDALLIQVAQRMRDISRASDLIGRLGGDEFAIVLPGANQAGAENASLRLLESIRMPYLFGQETVQIGASIGIAIYPGDGATAEQLLTNADTALYQAKAAGRNTWCAYASADGQREHQRMLLEQDLRAAVASHQFTLAYQPICSAATSEPVGFEALLRWTHPRRGAVSPAEFIPIAEQTGLIIPLGRWVIEVACAEAATWALPLNISVNLSPAQFRDRDLLGFIQEVLMHTGLPPARLSLEVTEGLLLDDAEDVVRTMQDLRAMGIRMVLDDFGTAHSNLSYLRGFPFDTVKIDRSFLRALNSDPQARALVEAILAMARALELDVVGEGVETQEQLALLSHLQCRWVQGYLLGRPAPSEDTRDRIRKLAEAKAEGGTPLHPERPVVHA